MDKNTAKENKHIELLEKNIQDNIDRLYTDVKGSDPNISRTIDYMRTRMHKSIDALINNNISNTGMSNISSLYSRIQGVQSDKRVIDSIIHTFENDSIMDNLMGMYSQNIYLKELDKEIDVIIKYMPKLHEALDTRKEAVLSADHFTKDAINIKPVGAELSEVNADNNIQSIKTKYNIDDLLDRVYRETDMYGECFIYCVPYKKAIERILSNGKLLNHDDDSLVKQESCLFSLNESGNIVTKDNPSHDYIKNTPGLQIEFNKSGIITESIIEHRKMEIALNESANISLNEANKEFTTTITNKSLDKELYKTDRTSQDGLISSTEKTNSDKGSIKVPGCVVKILDHTMVKPLYIDDVCLGYYYIECDKQMSIEQMTFSSTLGGLKPGNTARRLAENRSDGDSEILKKIAIEISNHIDSKFVNANQDLTKEIYLILKYNMEHNGAGRINKVRVTFISAEDIIHSYFKKDSKSNRGISALYRALFPAKLYSCLYISNVIAILTRGNDKRVYYVKQNVDTNISAVLLNTINQIKKSNFGLRQIENMNNIMNITGRFNDYVIPESNSGEAPVRFEIMQGQDVTHPTELMNQLEEMAVNATDVPLEVVQARMQLDYATHYTMSNTRFLRKVYNLQAKYTKICNKLLTRIYDAEFECEDSVNIELPPPLYLSLTNSSQMFQSANEHAEQIAAMYIDVNNEDSVLVDKVKSSIKKFYMRSFIPEKAITQLIDQARMEFAKEKKEDNSGM